MFARATPEKAEITEEYRFLQEISANPTISVDEDRPPTGAIDVVVPYDGYDFFSRAAVDDVTRQIEQRVRRAGRGNPTASVGHLVLSNAEGAVLVDGGQNPPLAPTHGAIPLRVPIHPAAGHGLDDLSSDLHEAALHLDYRPAVPAESQFPVTVDAYVFDPDDSPVVPDAFLTAPPVKRKKKQKSKGFPFASVHQVAFSSELQLTFVVHLHWPRRSSEEPAARIRRVSLNWPTITSLTDNFLRFQMDGVPFTVQYDPVRSSLEWSQLPIPATNEQDQDDENEPANGDTERDDTAARPVRRRASSQRQRSRDNRQHREENPDVQPREASGPDNSGPDGCSADDRLDPDDEDDLREGRTWTPRKAEITLYVKQPGQLRNEEELTGQIEVEVDELLSGIDARLFDACGRRQKKGTLTLRTRVNVTFTLLITQVFDRRLIRATQTLHFDEVVPDPSRIDDIVAALRDQGFNVEKIDLGTSSNDHPRWMLYGSRTEGPNTIKMGLVVDGKLSNTRRRAAQPGHPRYTSDFETGELQITIYGEVPRNSRELTQEINKLRESLGERFRHVQAAR